MRLFDLLAAKSLAGGSGGGNASVKIIKGAHMYLNYGNNDVSVSFTVERVDKLYADFQKMPVVIIASETQGYYHVRLTQMSKDTYGRYDIAASAMYWNFGNQSSIETYDFHLTARDLYEYTEQIYLTGTFQ